MASAQRLPEAEIGLAAREGTAAFVLSLRERGVVSRPVLRAMEVVPRHAFAPRRFADLARSDIALPLASGQTMTAPMTVAAMLVALDVRPGQRILEIGTGTGYVAALLAEMGGQVHSIERDEALLAGAQARLEATGRLRDVHLYRGDGLGPAPDAVRFDRILLNGSLAEIGTALTDQIGQDGRLVGALRRPEGPCLVTVVRRADGLETNPGARLRLSPLRGPAPPSRGQAVYDRAGGATEL